MRRRAVWAARRGYRPVGGLLLLVSVVALCASATLGQVHSVGPTASGGPTAQPAQEGGYGTLLEIANPVGVAATTSALLITVWGNSSIVYADENGEVFQFAKVPYKDPNSNITGISISPGFGGFPKNYAYVGQGPYIFQINPKGTPVKLFATIPGVGNTAIPTGVTFDTVGSFGYAMIVTAGNGGIYSVSSSGVVSQIASLEDPAFGPSVTPLAFGLGGAILVGTGSSGQVVAVSPDGEVFDFGSWPGATSVAVVPSRSCSYDQTGYSYFIADYTSDQIIGFTSSMAYLPNQALVTSAGISEPQGIGNLSAYGGAAQPFYSTSDELWGSSWVSCPVFGAVAVVQHANWYPYEMAYDPLDSDMYVTDNMSNQVYFFNKDSQVIGQATVGSNPTGVVYDPANGEMLVSNSGSDDVSIFNASNNLVRGAIPVGGDPQGLAYDPLNEWVYVADNGTNNLTAIEADNQTVPVSIPTDPEPFGVAFDALNGYIYTANFGGTVTVINGTTRVATFYLDGPATNLVQNVPPTGRMFVTVYGDSQVARLGTSKLLAYLPAGIEPFGIAFDPKDGYMFVSNHADGTLTILRGPSTVIETVVIGEPGGPWGVAYDPANGLIYVAGVLIGDPRTILGGGG